MCRKLINQIFYISQYGTSDPLLENHMVALNTKNLPQNFQKDIQLLKQSAAHNQVVSLSANQIQMQHRMFTILRPSLIKTGKWNDYDQVTPNDYRVIVNPTIVSQSPIRLKDFQECPSLPGLRFSIWNPINQTYKYLSPILKGDEIKFEQKNEKLKGFESRIFDHQIRHLQGFLALDPKISHSQISVSQDYQDNPLMYQLVQKLKEQLQFTSEENMIKLMKKGVNQKKAKTFMNPQNIPQKISKDMKGKMNKSYKRIKQIVKQQQK